MGLFDALDPDLEKAIHIAVKYLGYRPRSEQEVTNHLAKKNIDKNIIVTVIDLLKRYDYLNDETFATLFIENRKRHSPKSKFALGYELKQKGVCSGIREKLLADYNDASMAKKALGVKMGQWQHFDLEIQKKKAMNFLRYRGFGYEACMAAWEDVAADQGYDFPA